MIHHILDWDASLFLWLNGHLANPLLDPFMNAATDLGNGFYLYPIGLALMLLFARSHVLRDAVLWTSTSLIGFALGEILKHAFARQRPLSYFGDAISRHAVHVHVVGPHLYAFSFPSGHSYTIFSAASLFGYLYPRIAVPLYLVACTTGLSRVYVGAHFPGDVLGGAAIGLVSTALTIKLVWPRIPERWLGSRSLTAED